MLAYTYVSPGKFELLDKPRPRLQSDRDAIVLRDMDRTLTLETGRDGRGVTVSFPGMDYVGIWHKPKTDAPYVCIEPWCSLPAVQDVVTVMEERRDYLRLEAGGVYRNRWTIEIHSRAQ